MGATTGQHRWDFTADGNGTSTQFSGGKATLSAIGTFGGGTLKWQRSINNSTWVDISTATGTSNYDINVECGSCQIRPVLSGSTTPSLRAEIGPFVQ